jgi:hypothetical protein
MHEYSTLSAHWYCGKGQFLSILVETICYLHVFTCDHFNEHDFGKCEYFAEMLPVTGYGQAMKRTMKTILIRINQKRCLKRLRRYEEL